VARGAELSCATSGGGGHAFEDNDRKYPVGVLLVGGRAVGDHGLEAVAFLACCHDGLGLIAAVAELDRHGRVGSQVVEPGRVLGTPALEPTTNTRPLSSIPKPSGTVVRRPVRAFPHLIGSRSSTWPSSSAVAAVDAPGLPGGWRSGRCEFGWLARLRFARRAWLIMRAP
jgi:hypothetical protein